MDAAMFSSLRKLRNHVKQIEAYNNDNDGLLTPRELVRIDAEFAPSIVGTANLPFLHVLVGNVTSNTPVIWSICEMLFHIRALACLLSRI